MPTDGEGADVCAEQMLRVVNYVTAACEPWRWMVPRDTPSSPYETLGVAAVSS